MSTTEVRLIFTPTSGSVDSQELEQLVLELKSEIEQAPGSGFQINETQQHNEGALGPEWLPILTAVVSSHLAVEVVKGLASLIKDWLARKKPVVVTIKGPHGEYQITGEHMSGTEIETIATRVVAGRNSAASRKPT